MERWDQVIDTVLISVHSFPLSIYLQVEKSLTNWLTLSEWKSIAAVAQKYANCTPPSKSSLNPCMYVCGIAYLMGEESNQYSLLVPLNLRGKRVAWVEDDQNRLAYHFLVGKAHVPLSYIEWVCTLSVSQSVVWFRQ